MTLLHVLLGDLLAETQKVTEPPLDRVLWVSEGRHAGLGDDVECNESSHPFPNFLRVLDTDFQVKSIASFLFFFLFLGRLLR